MKKMSNIAWLFLLLVGFDAQAFYNPTTGRWLNRDPIGERGGLNAYGITRNDLLRFVDRFGLVTDDYVIGSHYPALEFHAIGEAYRDPWYANLWTAWDSGHTKSTSAWYRSWVRWLGLNTGGICNSGKAPKGSSYVHSYVVNNTLCCWKLRATCHYTFKASISIGGEMASERLIELSGRVLDSNIAFQAWAHPQHDRTSVYAADHATFSERFDLPAGARRDLYNLHTRIAFTPRNDATGEQFRGEFSESLEASCMVKIVGGCSKTK
jgi:hypothetical protein